METEEEREEMRGRQERKEIVIRRSKKLDGEAMVVGDTCAVEQWKC